ncbi:hypothetical protein ASPBRDRAFT_49024 [Aspergillus brasiliensis CBS 101740]|uniref:Uncharacterized protein n=1 Tax=Aspergillus brasiliensis (strain CBS 101740 / IMI 381727 / IBT 21946) TaxID=767769 RepID=A0A1L9U4B1_ASPBC|nr:hypothetical protein ASPBRDRAFT_49024 [Aspergillus brasiliensis CBS 101740]
MQEIDEAVIAELELLKQPSLPHRGANTMLGLTASDVDRQLKPRRSIDPMVPTRTQCSVTLNDNGPSVLVHAYPDPSHRLSVFCKWNGFNTGRKTKRPRKRTAATWPLSDSV